MYSIISPRWRIRFACSLLLAVPVASPARAQQQEASIEVLAHLLAAEDSRSYDAALFRTSARDVDPLVRQHAALALGRIGNTAGTGILLELLADPDSSVQAEAAFALGLMRDRSALPRLRQLVLEPPGGTSAALLEEAVGAIALIGGPEASQALIDLFARSSAMASSSQAPPMLHRALGDAWRLGARVPVPRLIPFASSPDPETRWRTVYSLARLQAPAAVEVLVAAADDSSARIRATAVRALTASYADSAGVDQRALATRVRRLAADPDAGVRINALRALATYPPAGLAGVAVERLADSHLNVRMQALATLGQLGGADAVAALRQRVATGAFGFRRQALLSLAESSPADVQRESARFLADPDWRMRAAAAEALGVAGGDSASTQLQALIRDGDSRIAAAAFHALRRADSAAARSRATGLLRHPDPVIRSEAASVLATASAGADVAPLVDAYELALKDPIPDARLASIAALGSIESHQPGSVIELFIRRFPRPRDYVVYRAAAQAFPGLASRWTPVDPIPTGMELGDYRDIARRLEWPARKNGVLPGITIETGRGSVAVSLFAGDAPLTVNAILRLVERRFFDGGGWHRVVPGFVAQAGDPRGDGAGGPGFVLRDEINRRQYDAGYVGMALDGPDTGGSQFFITFSPQPHLDAVYTVIGRVDSGMDVLEQIVQGDRIRRIRLR